MSIIGSMLNSLAPFLALVFVALGSQGSMAQDLTAGDSSVPANEQVALCNRTARIVFLAIAFDSESAGVIRHNSQGWFKVNPGTCWSSGDLTQTDGNIVRGTAGYVAKTDLLMNQVGWRGTPEAGIKYCIDLDEDFRTESKPGSQCPKGLSIESFVPVDGQANFLVHGNPMNDHSTLGGAQVAGAQFLLQRAGYSDYPEEWGEQDEVFMEALATFKKKNRIKEPYMLGPKFFAKAEKLAAKNVKKRNRGVSFFEILGGMVGVAGQVAVKSAGDQAKVDAMRDAPPEEQMRAANEMLKQAGGPAYSDEVVDQVSANERRQREEAELLAAEQRAAEEAEKQRQHEEQMAMLEYNRQLAELRQQEIEAQHQRDALQRQELQRRSQNNTGSNSNSGSNQSQQNPPRWATEQCNYTPKEVYRSGKYGSEQYTYYHIQLTNNCRYRRMSCSVEWEVDIFDPYDTGTPRAIGGGGRRSNNEGLLLDPGMSKQTSGIGPILGQNGTYAVSCKGNGGIG